MSLCNRRMELLTRRSVLQHTACGFGWLAFSALAASKAIADPFAGVRGGSVKPGTHFPAKAKRVIFLYMRGGPSHVDTFDYKP